jgi:hypothetical protein
MSQLRKSVLALAALIVLAATVAPAGAATAAGIDEVYLSNPTSYNITYSIRYGDGNWKQRTLGPGERFTWVAPAEGESFYLRFSTDIGNGGRHKVCRLDPFASYSFGITPSGLSMDLFHR